jgi:hypothetical protein
MNDQPPDAIEPTRTSPDATAKEAEEDAGSNAGRWSSPAARLLRVVLAIGVFLLVVALAWEAFKWVFGDPWRLEDFLGTGGDR